MRGTLLVLPCEYTSEEELDFAQSPIINGTACGASELPQTVALLVDATVNFGGGPTLLRRLSCTGTVIAPDVVLTAAHCIEPALFGTRTS